MFLPGAYKALGTGLEILGLQPKAARVSSGCSEQGSHEKSCSVGVTSNASFRHDDFQVGFQ